jgi:hypothetical protein
MIVLGDDEDREENEMVEMNWRYYVYEHGNFVELRLDT